MSTSGTSLRQKLEQRVNDLEADFERFSTDAAQFRASKQAEVAELREQLHRGESELAGHTQRTREQSMAYRGAIGELKQMLGGESDQPATAPAPVERARISKQKQGKKQRPTLALVPERESEPEVKPETASEPQGETPES